MTSPSFIASSRFFFTSNGGVVILFYYNIFDLILEIFLGSLEIFSGFLSGCDGFVINFGIIKMQTPRDNTAFAPTP